MSDIRLAIRTYSRGVLQTQEMVDLKPEDSAAVLYELAEKHVAAMAAAPGHVEIEFLDEPDVGKRFFRIGTDPSAMRRPLAINLDDLKLH